MLDRTGQQYGNYRLIRPLGHGGFADVYLAEHVYLGTKAAIKLLQTRLDQNSLPKFLSEARIIANLTHPHIVRVLEFGVEPTNNTPFLVMDYASRGTLRQSYPPGTRVPLAQVVATVEQVASGLQYAHGKNIIHRDVKPENMLVGENGSILLADFGIAVIAQTSRYRSAQEVGGTAVYMAPEQLQGRATAASDQYALAVVVYEWLSGTRPFEGSFPEVLAQHLTVAPPRLGERVPGLPTAVEDVIHKALAKEPQWRFPTVEEFAQTLKRASLSSSSARLSAGPDSSTFIKPPLPNSTRTQPTLFQPSSNTIPPAPYLSGNIHGTSTPHSHSSGPMFPPTIGSMETIKAKPVRGKTGRNVGIAAGCILLLALLIGALVLHNGGTSLPGTQSGNQNNNRPASSGTSGSTNSGNGNGSTATSTPIPTAIPANTVLYNANGFTDHWIGSPEWKAVGGQLGSDGSSSTSFTTWAPKQMPVANYEVKAQIEFVRSTYNQDPGLFGANYEFGIMLRGDGNSSGYEVGMESLSNYLAQNSQATGAQGAIVGLVQNDNTSGDSFVSGFSMGNARLKERDYPLDNTWHAYRVDVQGNDIKLYLDDTLLLETTDNSYLSSGYIGLRSVDADVNVKSFVVSAL
jgi:serine/threonine protein kinase